MRRRSFLKRALGVLALAIVPTPKLPPMAREAVEVPLRHVWGSIAMPKESLRVGSRGAFVRAMQADYDRMREDVVAEMNRTLFVPVEADTDAPRNTWFFT